jgi:hypothetical protein
LLIIVLLTAFALRLVPLDQNRFLEDEALYAYWGLQIATGADPLLNYEPVDKPPLYPYALAFLFSFSTPLLTGSGGETASPSAATNADETFAAFPPNGEAEKRLETVARLPSLFASITSIALVYALGRALYQNTPVALLAALLLALSPFDILFASTAFTDPLMTALVLGALLAAARDRLGAAGLLMGLAAATKQQALFFLPLIIAVGAFAPANSGFQKRREKTPSRFSPPTWLSRRWVRRWFRFVLALVLVLAGILCWDLWRIQRPGLFEQSLISYGGLGPAQPQALASRALGWLGLVGDFTSTNWLNLLLGGALGLWIVGNRFIPRMRGPNRIDLAILAFVLCYLLLHWLVDFQVWDRYLLSLIPLLALLAARASSALGAAIPSGSWRTAYAIGLGLTLIIGLARPALQATRSELPLGGDHGAYDGIDELATYLRSQAPHNSVLYHYWLGYHYRFYLYGASLRLHWYPDAEDLRHDAYVYRREPRYIAFPAWQDSSPAVAALAEAGIDLVPFLETTRRDGTVSFRLYRLEGP